MDVLELSARMIDSGELIEPPLTRLVACQLVEYALSAAPGDAAGHDAASTIYRARRKHERSPMAKGIYADEASRTTSP